MRCLFYSALFTLVVVSCGGDDAYDLEPTEQWVSYENAAAFWSELGRQLDGLDRAGRTTAGHSDWKLSYTIAFSSSRNQPQSTERPANTAEARALVRRLRDTVFFDADPDEYIRIARNVDPVAAFYTLKRESGNIVETVSLTVWTRR